jgi:hypothetical protein
MKDKAPSLRYWRDHVPVSGGVRELNAGLTAHGLKLLLRPVRTDRGYAVKLPMTAGLLLLALSLQPSAGAAAEQASVEVRFAGLEEGSHYAALVPEEQAWAEPLRETVAPRTAPAVSWEVPPGRYRVVCAAHLRHVAFLPAFSLDPGERRVVACSTAGLVAVTGELRSAADDSPIAGARVGHTHAFLLDFPRKLSAMGEAFTFDDRSTVTDARGRFQLLGAARFSFTVWIEANGFSAAWLPDTRFAPGGTKLGVVHLEKGASLRARLEGDASAWARYRIALRRQQATDQDEREKLSRRIWRRSLQVTSLVWPSLSPGEYDVLFEPMDSLGAPTKLTTVSLLPGEERQVVLTVPPALASFTFPAATVGTELRLLLREEVPEGGGDLELLRFDGVAIAPVTASSTAVAGGTLWKVPAGCHAGWLYWLQGASQVSTPVAVRAGGCAKSLPLQLFSAAEIHGQMIAPAGAGLPAIGSVAAARCARRTGESGEPAGSFPIAVGKDGRWSAEIPAGCVDLAIETGDFSVTAYRSLHAEAGSRSDLGAQNLTFGGSLRARVTTDDGGAVEGAAVDLFPSRDVEKVVAASFGRRQLAAVSQGTSGAGGWVRLGGLPGGEFVVRVRAKGAPPFVSDPVRLAPREETVMPDLRLPAPAVLHVRLRPSEPIGSLYSSYLVNVKGLGPPDSIAGASVVAAVGTDGAAEFPQLAPGRWHLAVMARGGRATATLRQEDTQLRRGLNSLILELDAEVFHGRVTHRQLPLAATLELRPVPPDGRGVTRVASGGDGSFTVALERGGRYAVEVHEIGGPAGGTVPAVTFGSIDDLVEIRVPDGSVSGLVVDGQEKPLANAQVAAEQVAETRTDGAQTGDLVATALRTASGSDGRFRLDGLAAGSWTLVATLDGRTSDPVAASLQDGAPEEEIKLVISDREKLAGHVFSPSGDPVAGASVAIAFPPSETAIWPRHVVVMSAADGSFAVERLSPPDSVVNVAVQAPGFPIYTGRRPLTPGAMELQLSSMGGGVKLHLSKGSWGEFPGDLLIFVAADGSFVGSATARAERRSSWLALPSLSAGPWTLARLDSIGSEIVAVTGAARGLVPLARFAVVPGTSIEVEVATLRP